MENTQETSKEMENTQETSKEMENTQETIQETSKEVHKRPRVKVSKNNNKESKKKEKTLYEKKKEVDELKKGIKNLEDELLNEDTVDEENPWALKLEAQRHHLESLEKEILQDEKNEIDNFFKRAHRARIGSNKGGDGKLFQVAKNDAEGRVFGIVALSCEIIADCFSTPQVYLNPWGGPVKAVKYVYSWYHDLRKRENNIIPLSPGIISPRKRDQKTGEYKDIQFLISFFYSDKEFVKKCVDYYAHFGLELTIRKDKKFNRKWWIKLKVNNPENMIYFPEPKTIESTNQD